MPAKADPQARQNEHQYPPGVTFQEGTMGIEIRTQLFNEMYHSLGMTRPAEGSPSCEKMLATWGAKTYPL